MLIKHQTYAYLGTLILKGVKRTCITRSKQSNKRNINNKWRKNMTKLADSED